MENQEFILGYQWSLETKKYMGEYRFPKNKDKDEIYMPPFTTLIPPPICEKNHSPYWDGTEWHIDFDPIEIIEHPPITNYNMLMPDYIEYLKENDLWTDEDEIKMQKALKDAGDIELEKKRIQEEQERNRDYLSELREIRDYLISLSDWSQLPDVQDKFTSTEKERWIEYRQNLRDLPENIEDPKPLVLDPNHSDWPISPE
jgi:hypothetical protein